MHDVLADIMVYFVKSRIVVDEYVIAFRRALLPRYVNLRNQERFRMERAKLVVTRTDLEEMQDRLARSDTYAPAECGRDVSVRQQLGKGGDYTGTPIRGSKRTADDIAATNAKRIRPTGAVSKQQLNGHVTRY